MNEQEMTYQPIDSAIRQIQRACAVLALIRQSLTNLPPNHETIDAATFMLESVEDGLYDVCVFITPSDKLFILSREMSANTGRTNRKKK